MKNLFPAVLAAGFLFACSCSKAPTPPAAQDQPESKMNVDAKTQQQLGIIVQPAALRSVNAPISATGQLQMNEDRTWHVGAVLAGKIVSVPVRLGDITKMGQVVALMHSHDVYDARASRRQAIVELDRLKTLADQALRIRNRTQRLLDLKAASREQMEGAETAYQSARLSVANAQAEVDKADFHLRHFLDVPLNEAISASGDLDQVPIKAPAAGTVMERLANAGSVVSAGDPVITLSDLSTLWLIAAVNEADLSQVHRGQAVQISVRAYPDRKFPGKVSQLGERMDPHTRTLQVRVLVTNVQGLLKPDMFATVDFTAMTHRAAIYLPESAIQELDGKSVVFIRSSSGGFEPHPITTGTRAGRQVEILSGLELGTSVVIDGALLLKGQLLKGEPE